MRASRACLFLFFSFCLVMTLNSDPNTVDILLLIKNKNHMRTLQLSSCVVQTTPIRRHQTFNFVDRALIKTLVKEAKRKNSVRVFESLMSGLQVPPHVV